MTADISPPTARPRAVRRGRQRPGPAARRFGYLVAALVNALLLFLVNRSPGWDAVPFLTADTSRVLDLVNASMVVSLLVNLAFVVRDPTWFKALGDIVTTSVSVAASWRVWQVFPFDFTDDSLPWSTLTRVLLVIAIVGGMIGVAVSLVRLAKALVSQSD